jgi:hypothetical protein
MSETPMSPGVVAQLFRLYDYAFKQGVADAAETGDDFVADDYLLGRERAADYRLLSDPHSMDWKEWKFHLCRWCSVIGATKLPLEYLSRIVRPGYMMVALEVAQDFYVMGVEEWQAYKNRLPLEIFKTQPRVHWKPVKGRTLKPIGKKEMLSLCQWMSYKRKHLAEDGIGGCTPESHIKFNTELWRATRPVKKLKIDDY